MGLRRKLANLVNDVLEPLGARIVPYHGDAKPWDEFFARWIAAAEATGKDPNDVGDLEWADDPLRNVLEEYYLPHVKQDSVVLELGPGTGRLTRHVLPRCRSMILVDYSTLACKWLQKYLAGKGNFVVHQIEAPRLLLVESNSVDVVLANGVFEHVDVDDLVCFLEEFFRVLKRGGVAAFNFDTVQGAESWSWFTKHRGVPGTRCIFRFYHPAMLQLLAERAGFRLLRMSTSASRFAYVELVKVETGSGAVHE